MYHIKCGFVNTFFFGEKMFLGFFFIFLSKTIDIVVFCAMIYIVRRYT